MLSDSVMKRREKLKESELDNPKIVSETIDDDCGNSSARSIVQQPLLTASDHNI